MSKIKTKITQTDAQIVSELYRHALEATRDEIVGLRSGKVTPKEGRTPTEVIVYLGKQASSFASELRKLKSDETRGVSKITKTQVMAWLRRMDPSDRAAFLREAARIDAEESVLA